MTDDDHRPLLQIYMLRSLPVEAKKKRNASSKIKISRKEKGTTSTLHYVVGTSTNYIGTSIKLCHKKIACILHFCNSIINSMWCVGDNFNEIIF